MPQPLLAALAATLGMAALATPANATQIFVSHVAFSDGSAEFRVSDFDGPGGFPGVTFHAGRFAMTGNPGSVLGSPTEIFHAWCVDVFRTIPLGSVAIAYTIGALADDAATPPNPLSAAQISRIAGLAIHGETALAPPGDQPAVSAAIQAAIWQTLYPTAVISSTNAAAQAAFTALLGMSFAGSGGAVLQNFDSQGRLVRQALFGAVPGGDPFPDPTPIPAPAALGLFGLALTCLLAARRTRA